MSAGATARRPGENPRDRVVAVLRELARPASVAEVVELSGLHRNTVARHLDALVEAGTIVRSYDSRGRRGRPVGLYHVAPAAPQSGFVELAGLLARHLDGELRSDEAQRLGRQWALALRARDGGVDVVDALTDLGFEPTVSDDGHTVELHRCPLVPDSEPVDGVCALHTAMIRELVEAGGVDASRLTARPFVDGGPCRLHVGPGRLQAP